MCFGIHRQQFVLQRLGVLRNSQTTICITASWCVSEFTDSNLYYSVLVCFGNHRQQFVLQRLCVFRKSQTTIYITASWCVSEFTLTAMDVCLIVMITVIDLVSGFYPRLPPHWRTKTHSDITNAGSLQAISEYIFRHKMIGTSPSTALDDFYGTGMIIVFFAQYTFCCHTVHFMVATMTWLSSIYLIHNPVLSSFMAGATRGAEAAYPFGATEFAHGFKWGSCFLIISFLTYV